MNDQCLQQCLQCLHSAYSSAYTKQLFSQVNDLQCLQCLQLPTTQIHMRAHAHMGRLLCRELMALVALTPGDLRQQLILRALPVGTALALLMALPFTDRPISGRAS